MELGINPIILLSQIVNFVALAFLLRRFAYKPLLDLLDKRRERIEKGLEDAHVAKEARANAENERQKILEAARTEAQSILAEANRRGDAQVAQVLEQAREQAQRILEDARDEVQAERDRMLGQMRGHIAALSIAAAGQIIDEKLDERRQRQLVSEFFSGLQGGQVKLADRLYELHGERAVVISALPLSESDQSVYRSALQTQLGQVTVEFRTNPELLGGVVLQVGDVVVDGSMAGKLAKLQRNIIA